MKGKQMSKQIKQISYLISSIFLILLLSSCEDDVSANYILEAVKEGNIVTIDDSSVEINKEYVGEVDFSQMKIVTTGCFGAAWCVKMTGTKGRAIATTSEFSSYYEAGSERYPGDITSITYFSSTYYPNFDDSDVSFGEIRAKIVTWGGNWNNARVDWCEIEHPIFCVQEE